MQLVRRLSPMRSTKHLLAATILILRRRDGRSLARCNRNRTLSANRAAVNSNKHTVSAQSDDTRVKIGHIGSSKSSIMNAADRDEAAELSCRRIGANSVLRLTRRQLCKKRLSSPLEYSANSNTEKCRDELRDVVGNYYSPSEWASIVLLAVVCRLLSSVTLPTTGRRACGRSVPRRPGTWATLHGGPVVLRPVRVTPCFDV